MIIGVHALHDAHTRYKLSTRHAHTRATQFTARDTLDPAPHWTLLTAHTPPTTQKRAVGSGVLRLCLFASGEGEMIHDTPL